MVLTAIQGVPMPHQMTHQNHLQTNLLVNGQTHIDRETNQSVLDNQIGLISE